MNGFKQFLLRGNVVDLAVGVVIGASFVSVVTALVKDFVTPLIGAIAKVPDFSMMQFSVNGSHFMYGDFVNVFIGFLLVAATVYYFIVVPMNALIARSKREAPADPTTKKCPECFSEIDINARRCAYCTSTVA